MPAPRGKFIWYDVMTSDTKAATAFYSDVIGWQAQEHAMADNGSYTVFSRGERMVAGLMALPGELCAEGVRRSPPLQQTHWCDCRRRSSCATADRCDEVSVLSRRIHPGVTLGLQRPPNLRVRTNGQDSVARRQLDDWR